MAYNEPLTDRLREALAHVPKVVEKKMFRGITFMVNGKMCISVGNDEILCRIGPEKYEEVVEQNGCRPMIHSGRTMKGFVFVNEENIRRKKDLDYWINLCLDFNKLAKASPKSRKK
jgi:TfoX/Sxy family transcriptional regulator of competence genes